jgi:hypothetical protein
VLSLNNTILAEGHGWRERSQRAQWRGLMNYLRGITAGVIQFQIEPPASTRQALSRRKKCEEVIEPRISRMNADKTIEFKFEPRIKPIHFNQNEVHSYPRSSAFIRG